MFYLVKPIGARGHRGAARWNARLILKCESFSRPTGSAVDYEELIELLILYSGRNFYAPRKLRLHGELK